MKEEEREIHLLIAAIGHSLWGVPSGLLRAKMDMVVGVREIDWFLKRETFLDGE